MPEVKYCLIIKRSLVILALLCVILYLSLTFGRKFNFRFNSLTNTKGDNSSFVKSKHHQLNQLYRSNDSNVERSKLTYLVNRILNKLNNSTGISNGTRQFIYNIKQINASRALTETNASWAVLKQTEEYLLTLSKNSITSDRNLTRDVIKYLASLTKIAKTKVDETSNTHILDGKTTSQLKETTLKAQFSITEPIDTTPQPLCDTSKLLKGKIDIKPDVTSNQVKDTTALKRVTKGGTYRPEGCRTSDSVAIIVPYRDRQKHLEIFVNHMHTFLQRQQLQYGIFVAEIARPTTFNRGLLANVGFLAAQSTSLYNCYVIHDVDLIPTNDRNFYNCSSDFRHLAAANTKFGNNVPYNEYAGGVIALRDDIYENINGFSNLYFGWGGEDDDVWNRAKAEHYTLSRPEKNVGSYIALPHGIDALNPPNPDRFKLVGSGPSRRHNDGINSINYQHMSITQHDLYTRVYVKVDQKEVMQTNVVRTVRDIQIYESDLKTLGHNRVVNDKIMNSYFMLLQETGNNSVVAIKATYRQKKNTFLPDISNKTEYVFLPSKKSGHWILNVVYCKQKKIAYLDPVGNYNQKHNQSIRRAYLAKFHVVLEENTDIIQEMTYDKEESNSGVLVMMYAKRVVDGNTLSFQQTDIGSARTDIESFIRGM